MSRIGKRELEIPTGVTVTVNEGLSSVGLANKTQGASG